MNKYLAILALVTISLEVLAQRDSIYHIDEVAVYGQGQKKSLTQVESRLSEEELRRSLGSSLSSSLQGTRGVSSISTGATISKPVIQGMHSQRILIVNNGVRQQGQQWGDDHAPEIDLNNAGSISIVKGAGAVRYGSDALGGIILLRPYALPFGERVLSGHVSSMYGSNGNRYATTAQLGGAIGRERNIAWRLQGTYVNGGDRKTARYLLNNTAMREADLSASVGYKSKNFGSEFTYTLYTTKLGVMYTANLGSRELLEEKLLLGEPVELFPFTRHIDYPYQDVKHHTLNARVYYLLPRDNKLTLQYSYQHDARDEFHLRRANRSYLPSLSLRLNVSNIDLTWSKYWGKWRNDVGIYYGNMKNTNVAGTGVVPIIPNYTQNSAGLYNIVEYDAKPLGFEAGVRYDYQGSDARGIDMYSRAYGGRRHFNNITYNVGIKYDITSELTFRSNVGMAWRAPNMHEMYSQGLDQASAIYAVGDSTMRSERSTKWVASLHYHRSFIALTLDAFLQGINGYIYSEPSHDTQSLISGTYPIFYYKQSDAVFKGIDAEVALYPLKGLTYTSMVTAVWAKERGTDRYLPYIPPLRWTNSLRYDAFSLFGLKKCFTELSCRFTAKQNRFDPQTDLVSYSPPAYTLWRFSLGGDIIMGSGNVLQLMLIVDNLMNKEYKEYTNRYRYYAHDLGRDIMINAKWIF